MSDPKMDIDEYEEEIYVRTIEDVNRIIKHAKLDEKNLTQALYYPSSPLKSPRTGNANASLERSLSDSADNDLNIERTLEQRPILKIFHEYFKCLEIKPRFRKLGELLQMTRYSGPENEEFIDRKLLFTFGQLLDTIQRSRKKLVESLRQYHAMEYQGWMRILECEYEFRIVNLIVGLITENSWALDEVENEETINALEGTAPKQIVAGPFALYTYPSAEKENRYTYSDELVASCTKYFTTWFKVES